MMLTVNGQTIAPTTVLAVRVRRAARRPRADLLPEAGQVQGVHGRGHRGWRACYSADDEEHHLKGRFRLSCRPR